MSEEEKLERRIQLYKSLQDYPPVRDFVITGSGILEPMPENSEEWEIFNNELKHPEL